MRKRTVMRVNVDWNAEMASLQNNETLSDVRVLNFSASGLSFKSNRQIAVGESFIIHLPFASLPISVVRKLDDRYGALFINISLEEIQMIEENLYKDDGKSVLMEAISQF